MLDFSYCFDLSYELALPVKVVTAKPFDINGRASGHCCYVRCTESTISNDVSLAEIISWNSYISSFYPLQRVLRRCDVNSQRLPCLLSQKTVAWFRLNLTLPISIGNGLDFLCFLFQKNSNAGCCAQPHQYQIHKNDTVTLGRETGLRERSVTPEELICCAQRKICDNSIAQTITKVEYELQRENKEHMNLTSFSVTWNHTYAILGQKHDKIH